MYPKKKGARIQIGFIWLRIVFVGGLSSTKYETSNAMKAMKV
jgi:hypothetical protein